MKKRSISIYGHPTSVALEPAFWTELDRAAEADGISVSALIRRLDDERMERGVDGGLASYLRVYILQRACEARDELKRLHVDPAVDP